MGDVKGDTRTLDLAHIVTGSSTSAKALLGFGA